MRIVLTLGFSLFAALAAHADTVRGQNAGLRYSVPREWVRIPATSDVRSAQFRVPRAAGDIEDGELILFHYGAAQAAMVQKNFATWLAMFEQSDWKPAKDVAVTTMRKAGTLDTTLVDVTAIYTGGRQSDGTLEAGVTLKPNWRMLAGAVEGGGSGPWCWRLIGPEKTVAQAKPAFEAMLSASEAHQ